MALDLVEALPPGVNLPGRVQGWEVEGEVELVAVAVVGGHLGGVEEVDLAHDHPISGIAVEEPAHFAQQAVGGGIVVGRRPWQSRPLRWVVGQRRILADRVHGVGPEPVDAAIEPEAHHAVHGLHHRPLGPVDVGLLGEEQVQVVLGRALVEGPRRDVLAEGCPPVVGRTAPRCRVAPHVPAAVCARGRRTGVEEPGVAVGGVVGHPVDDDPQAPGVSVGQQPVEVGQRPEERVDIAVVAHVVAEVGHRRAVERRQPDGVDTQPDQVVEVAADPLEVADTLARARLGVGEGPGVDLVDHRRVPPRRRASALPPHVRRLAGRRHRSLATDPLSRRLPTGRSARAGRGRPRRGNGARG